MCPSCISMELVMYLGFDLIDAVPLNTDKITQPGYVGSIKRELMEKHTLQLQLLSSEPEFLVIQSGENLP